MIKITFKSHISVLLAYLINCEKVIIRALDRLEPEDISKTIPEENGVIYGFMWFRLQTYYKQYRKVMPQWVLSAAMEENFNVQVMQPEDKAKLDANISRLYSYAPTDFESEEGIRILQQVLEVSRVSMKVREAMFEDVSNEDLAQTINDGMVQASISSAEVIDGLSCLDDIFERVKPTPLGGPDINYFNLLCDGGLKGGETCLLIGPTGGYKTTIALDIAGSLALQGKYSMFSSYEQSADGGDIKVRMLVRLSGIKIDRLKMDNIKTELTTEEQESIKVAQKASPYILWHDRSNKIDKVSDIASQVQELIARGKKPEVVIIDQLFNWVNRWPECRKDDVFRKVSSQALDDLKHNVAEEFDVRVLVLHQLSAAMNGSSPSRKPRVSDAAENKGIANDADFSFLMGTQCPDTKCFWMATGKSRRGPKRDMVIEPDPQLCRVRESDKYVDNISNPGNFILRANLRKSGGSSSTVPMNV